MMRKTLFALSLLLGALSIAFGQDRQVTGKVTDATGEPLPGVTVLVVGTTTGSVTSFEGKYTLNIPAGANDIKFSSVGYKTQVVAVGAQTKIDISLQEDAEQLEEVMVVAYGVANKATFTGSATKVDGEKLQKIQTSSISKALEGMTSGVQITSSSGQPGTDATIRIRGVGSINASSKPLIVVDNVPYSGTLNSINPQDIASLTVLKDAAASALYGSRAANGVVMITTKKGKDGQTKVSFDAKVGVNSRAVPEYDIMKDPGMYMKTAWQMLANAKGGTWASENLITQLGGYNPFDVADNMVVTPDGKLTTAGLLYSDDWAEETFANGIRQEYNLNFSGGNSKSSHYFSLGYLEDEGIIDNSSFERITLRGNIDHKVTDYMKLGANIAYARGFQTAPKESSGTAFANAFMFTQNVAPIYPVYEYDAEGNRQYDPVTGEPLYDFGPQRLYGPNSNPTAMSSLDENDRLDDNFSARGFIDINLIKGLVFTANAGYDLQNINQSVFYNPTQGDAFNVQGRAYKYTYRYQTLNMSQLLKYNKTIGLHNISALVGHETYMYDRSYMYGEKTTFFINDNPEFDNAVNITGLQSSTRQHNIESYLANASYEYDGKYFASASFRTDGSSKFAPENRWGSFWSIGAGWAINKEGFMEGADKINNLKLKASYGVQGNDGILDKGGYMVYTPYTDMYEISNNDGKIAANLYYKGNPELSWETSYNFNAGIEMTAFDGRLTFEAEYFSRRTADLLFNSPVAPSFGYSYRPENIGDMENRGVDFTVGYDIISNSKVKWNVTVNGTHMVNEILTLPDRYKEDGIISGNKRLMEGGTIYDFYIQKYAGVDPETGKSLWYKNTYDEKGNITGTEKTSNYEEAERYDVGSSLPDFYGNLSTTVSYRGFDLSIITNFQIGGYVYDDVYSGLMHGNNLGNNWHTDILNAWTTTNTNTNIPVLDIADQDTNSRSDRFLKDASFFNIRSISLGYELPKSFLKQISVPYVRVYVAADNVALFSDMKGMDPRQYMSGSVSYEYAPIRTISGGININF